MGRLRKAMEHFARHYTDFIDHHGLGVVVASCLAVIVGTAVWTNGRIPEKSGPPVISTEDALSAAELMQQSLASAVRATAAPTQKPSAYAAPLPALFVLEPFDAVRLKPSGVSGLWRLHDAVDLAADPGEIVKSIADGVITDTAEESLIGAYLTIDHGDIEVTYAGLAGLAGLRTGDPVRSGQTIGFAGNGVVDETDMPPHLHLRVTRGGVSIDPMTLFDP